MSTPEENLEIATDESSDRDARTNAIDELETANECRSLADLVRSDGLDERYREQALNGLAHPQCRSKLETLAEEDTLPEGLQAEAETLLEETPTDSGAGP